MGHQKEEEIDGGSAPPPYTAVDDTVATAPESAPAYTVGESSASANVSTGRNSRFPPAFSVYYKTFAIHSGWTRKPQLMLHTGDNVKGPVLATATSESKWNYKNTVLTIPGPDGREDERETITMGSDLKVRKSAFPFTMRVGIGKETRRDETFEWRQSHGEEVKGLEGRSWGWKLVRLSSAAVTGGSSDGKEVVAVWAQSRGVSLTKGAKFQFLGSGLSGVLGDRWSVTAVISALRIWYLEYQTLTSASAVAGTGA